MSEKQEMLDNSTATSTSPTYQRVSERVQQWNRAIPEAGYITLGTIRYGVRLSNPNLASYGNANEDSMSPISSPSAMRKAKDSLSSTNGNGEKSDCCCIGTTGIVMPWNNNYIRTRLPIPTLASAKNRTSSPSTSTTLQQPQQQQQQLNILNSSPSKNHYIRETSPTTSVCCYTNNSSINNSKKLIKYSNSNNNNNNSEKYKNNNNNSLFSGDIKNNNNSKNNCENCEENDNFSVENRKNLKKNSSVGCSDVVVKSSLSSSSSSSSSSSPPLNTKIITSTTTAYPRQSQQPPILFASSSPPPALVSPSFSTSLSQPSALGKSPHYPSSLTTTHNSQAAVPPSPSSSTLAAASSANGLLNNSCFSENRCENLQNNNKNNNNNSVSKNKLNTTIKNRTNSSENSNSNLLNCFTTAASSNKLSVGGTSLSSVSGSSDSTDADGASTFKSDVLLITSIPPDQRKSSLPIFRNNDNSFTSSASTSSVFSAPHSTQSPSHSQSLSPATGIANSQVRRINCDDNNKSSTVIIRKLTPKLTKQSFQLNEFDQTVDVQSSSSKVPSSSLSSSRINANNHSINNRNPSNCKLKNHDNCDIKLNGKSKLSYSAASAINVPDDVVDGKAVVQRSSAVDAPNAADDDNERGHNNRSRSGNDGDLDAVVVLNDDDFSFIDSASDDLSSNQCPLNANYENYNQYYNNDELSELNKKTFIHSVPKINSYILKSSSVSANSEQIVSDDNRNYLVNDGPASVKFHEFYEQNSNSRPYQYQRNPLSDNDRRNSSSTTIGLVHAEEEEVEEQQQDEDIDEEKSGKDLANANETGANQSKRFAKLSPDNSSSGLNCFGKSQFYARLSPEKLTMEKRRNTLDRFQKLGFGRKSSSTASSSSTPTESKASDKGAGTKTERLKELTELLKGSRTPPIPPPRRPKHAHSVEKFDRFSLSPSSSTLSIDKDNKDALLHNPLDNLPPTPDGASDTQLYHAQKLRPNISAANLENYRLCGASIEEEEAIPPPPPPPPLPPPLTAQLSTQLSEATPVSPGAAMMADDELFSQKLTRPESRTIVGSYTQKTIPFRSASFSQVDYSSGKYIRSALGALKASLTKPKENSVIDNTNLTLPRKKDNTGSVSPTNGPEDMSDNTGIVSSAEPQRDTAKPMLKTELSINLQNDSSLESVLENANIMEINAKNLGEMIEMSSKRNSDIETIVEEPSGENSEYLEEERPRLDMNVVQASEMVLEPLIEEEIPITTSITTQNPQNCLQKATTCLIPVPVYECVVKEWSTANSPEQWINASEEETAKLIEEVGNNLDIIKEMNENEMDSPRTPTEKVFPQIQQAEMSIVIDDVDQREPSPFFDVDENFQNIKKTIDQLADNPIIIADDQTSLLSIDQDNAKNSNVSSICTDFEDDFVKQESPRTSGIEEPKLRKCNTVDGEFVEVRKRHSNNDTQNVSSNDSLQGSANTANQGEEKRRIDKSRRRKGIYIQWPAIDKNNDLESDSNENSTPEDAKTPWQCEKLAEEVIKTGVLIDGSESFVDVDLIEGRKKGERNPNLTLICTTSEDSCSSRFPIDISTPDSDITRPCWPKQMKRQSLTYQSSDEKDESQSASSPPMRPSKNLYVRSDSISDNESERGSSRDRTSASPAPSNDQDLKRYSKRPLRGPYGQMLEAEMKKPTKVHYDELLEELNRNDSISSLSPLVGANNIRNRSSGSHSLDETNASHKSSKPRKSSAHLPIPTHTRTASSPSQLIEIGSQEVLVSHHKRYPSNIEQRTLDNERAERFKQDSKKLSLDSNISDKIPKRTSSDISDKHVKRTSSNVTDKAHQKRSLDEMRLSQASRTPSERSFILNTPETPKTLDATPELLAELLKGSSERLVAEQHHSNNSGGGNNNSSAGGNSNSSGSTALPTAVLKCLDTRTHVVVELFNTEKSYVESLQTVVLKYLNPLKLPENSGIIDSQIVDEIFFMVPAIANIHERFLDELKRRLDSWDPLQKVGDAFVEVFSKPPILDTYTSFVNNWNKAKDAIRTTRSTRPAFARFLEAMAREHKGKLSLDNLLIKPVQKFPNYELIFSRLIKHTDIDHPDQKPLQDALKLVHDILLHLNCKKKEALENGQREATLRDLECVIEGMNELVTPDRVFLLFDLVSMPSGQAPRKERGFFLFNDLLVITSIKRRSGTIRKPNTTCPGSVASTLDTNKYKFLMKISLDDLEIVKSKDENIRRIMKEIEQLSEDSNKLQQISELASSLRCTHNLLEESIRDLQREIQKQLTERQSNDTQLSLLELTLNASTGVQHISVVFSKPEKRTQWEETFTESKQKLVASLERYQVPDFLASIPIRKTRAGLQFTCAAPTLGQQRDVWVCNSDGYVGQVCVLSLLPEPTVTSCNGVCNARILCLSSVPANIETNLSSSTSHLNTNVSISIEDTTHTSHSPRNSMSLNDKKVRIKPESANIELDSGSSSDESETEAQTERAPSPAIILPNRHQELVSDECENQQSTMWLGTEDGCIHVYNCTDNIRIKKNKIKIQHISAVYSILYLDNRVFVSLANGDICVYTRDHNGWNTTSPFNISVGSVSTPVTKLLNVHGKLWCAIQGNIKILSTTTLQVENQIQISTDSKPITNMTVLNNCVWISIQNSAHIKCCHINNYEIIFEVNLAPSVNKMLSNCDDIIRQHKAACLRVTSLLACKDLIWVGTSAGVLLTILAQNVSKGSTVPVVTGIPHGHTGHVRFLTYVEAENLDNYLTNASNNAKNATVISSANKAKSDANSNVLVISGGDGYEDFRTSNNNSMSEVAGREDSTNHLLLWRA